MCVVWDLELIVSSNLIKVIVTTYDYAPLSFIYGICLLGFLAMPQSNYGIINCLCVAFE